MDLAGTAVAEQAAHLGHGIPEKGEDQHPASVLFGVLAELQQTPGLAGIGTAPARLTHRHETARLYRLPVDFRFGWGLFAPVLHFGELRQFGEHIFPPPAQIHRRNGLPERLRSRHIREFPGLGGCFRREGGEQEAPLLHPVFQRGYR